MTKRHAFSLTEVSSKGSHFAIKEGNTQKHTQSVNRIHGQPAADRNGPFQKRLKIKGFIFLCRDLIIRKKKCLEKHFFFTFFKFSLHLHKERYKTNAFFHFFNFSLHLHKEHCKTKKTLVLQCFWSTTLIKLIKHYVFPHPLCEVLFFIP